jgi:hypothetical protein
LRIASIFAIKKLGEGVGKKQPEPRRAPVSLTYDVTNVKKLAN